MGKDEKVLMQIARRQNLPLPPRILNAPELLQGLELFSFGFQSLTTSRTLSQGAIGPIPYHAINEFCKAEDLIGEQREDFFYHIERIDNAYMKWQTKKAHSDNPTPKEDS
jgi:hypothetical protein